MCVCVCVRACVCVCAFLEEGRVECVGVCMCVCFAVVLVGKLVTAQREYTCVCDV